MITAQQVRAGRALLNWSQKELAEKSGVSLNAINNFEREIVGPRKDTLVRLRISLEQAGLEFIGETGVNQATDKLAIEQHAGPGYMRLLVDDIISAARAGASNLYFNGIDFARMAPEELAELDRWWKAKPAHDVEERVMLPYGDFSFSARDRVYRWAAKEKIGEVAYVTYGQNMALMIQGASPRIILIRSRSIAETFRNQFELSWSAAKEPSFEQHIRGWEEFRGRLWDEAPAQDERQAA